MRVVDQRHSGAGPVTLEPGVLRPAGTEEWTGRVSLLQTDGIRVDAMSLAPHTFRAGPGSIGFRPSLAAAWVREGCIRGESGGARFEVLPGQAVLWDTRLSIESSVVQDLRLLRIVVDLDDLPDHLVPAVPRPAGVLRNSPVVQSTFAFAATLLQTSRRTPPAADDAIAAHALVALMTGLVAELDHQRGPVEVGGVHDRRGALEAHIAAHLADPGLGPVSLARDFGISVRSVHAAFAGSGSTAAAVIRRLRVCGVQRTIRDRAALPRMAELAVQHGFRDASQLSRTFRELTGMPVRDWYAANRG